jgi:hypothetical protein
MSTMRSLCCGLVLLFPLTAEADDKNKARPFRKSDFMVHSAQAIGQGTFTITAEMGYPFVRAGLRYGLSDNLSVGFHAKSEWALTVGADADVLLSLVQRKKDALGLRVEAGFLTLGAGDPDVLAFGPGSSGLNDGSEQGLPHLFAATSNVTVTPQLVYSYKDVPGTWFVGAGATIQTFLDDLPDTPAATEKTAVMPRISGGIERVMSDNLSLHAEAVLGAYIDPNTASGESETSAIAMLRFGLNLFLPK